MKVTGLSRVSKDIIIREIKKELKGRPTFFVTDHGTISGTDLDKLRTNLRRVKSRYLVVKRTLVKKAFEASELKSVSEQITGAIGIAFTDGDPSAPSKVLLECSKANETFKVQLGVMNGQIMDFERVKFLASLPSREVLVARVVGTIQAPLSRFVGVLAGNVRKIVTVLDAIAKKKS